MNVTPQISGKNETSSTRMMRMVPAITGPKKQRSKAVNTRQSLKKTKIAIRMFVRMFSSSDHTERVKAGARRSKRSTTTPPSAGDQQETIHHETQRATHHRNKNRTEQRIEGTETRHSPLRASGKREQAQQPFVPLGSKGDNNKRRQKERKPKAVREERQL